MHKELNVFSANATRVRSSTTRHNAHAQKKSVSGWRQSRSYPLAQPEAQGTRWAGPVFHYDLKMADKSPITANELAKKAGLSLESLDFPFRVDHAHILAGFCDPWETIGYHLRLNSAEINAIKEDNSSAEKRRIATLQAWKEKFAYRATYRVLIEALISCGHAQQALDLCIKISKDQLLRPASESDNSESVIPRSPSLLMIEPMSPVELDSSRGEFRHFRVNKEPPSSTIEAKRPRGTTNGNQEEIITEGEGRKPSLSSDEDAIREVRDYFAQMTCNLRVLGSQLGLEPYELNEIAYQSASLYDQKQRLVDKCKEKEKLQSWEHLAATLEKPALNLRKMAGEIRTKHVYSRQCSLESCSSISSLMSPGLESVSSQEASFSSSMEVDHSK